MTSKRPLEMVYRGKFSAVRKAGSPRQKSKITCANCESIWATISVSVPPHTNKYEMRPQKHFLYLRDSPADEELNIHAAWAHVFGSRCKTISSAKEIPHA